MIFRRYLCYFSQAESRRGESVSGVEQVFLGRAGDVVC